MYIYNQILCYREEINHYTSIKKKNLSQFSIALLSLVDASTIDFQS